MDAHTRFDLPDDVLRLIVDTFAIQSRKNDVLRLFTVSRSVKAWTEFHVYSKVVLKSREQVLSFSAALNGELAFCRPSRHVELLWLLCTDTSATQYLSDVPNLCPNLVHFAFDGSRAPFIGIHVSRNEQPRLTRLSICSPSLLDDEFCPPISWEHLTHLQIFGSGNVDDSTLYLELLGPHIEKLGSLEHICIELTYPSPETELFNFTFFSEMVMFDLYMEEDRIRDLLVCLPQLRKVVIKGSFTYPRFRILWDDLVAKFKDESRVVFKLQALQNQDFYENALPCPTLSEGAWHGLLCNALDEANQLWMSDD